MARSGAVADRAGLRGWSSAGVLSSLVASALEKASVYLSRRLVTGRPTFETTNSPRRFSLRTKWVVEKHF
jgi:hypothetical protein